MELKQRIPPEIAQLPLEKFYEHVLAAERRAKEAVDMSTEMVESILRQNQEATMRWQDAMKLRLMVEDYITFLQSPDTSAESQTTYHFSYTADSTQQIPYGSTSDE
jgi:hypothetical protein